MNPLEIRRRLSRMGWITAVVGLALMLIAALDAYLLWVMLPAAGLSLQDLAPELPDVGGTLDTAIWVIGLHGLAFVIASLGLVAGREWGRLSFILLSALTAILNAAALVGLSGAGPLLVSMRLAGPYSLSLIALGLAATVAGFLWCVIWLMRPEVRACFRADPPQ